MKSSTHPKQFFAKIIYVIGNKIVKLYKVRPIRILDFCIRSISKTFLF